MNHRALVGNAVAAWRAGQYVAADELFRQSLDAHRPAPSKDLDFALGQYGAFLLARDRKDDAELVLDLALDQGTDRHTIWFDYLWLVGDRHDLEKFTYTVDRMAATVPYHVDAMFILSAAGLPSAIASPSVQYNPSAWFMIAYGRRTDRDGASAFVEAVGRWVIDRALRSGHTEDRWVATGNVGRILEKTGRVDDAIRLWNEAFDEGSCDPATIVRLTMHLERAKDCDRTTAVVQKALRRRLPADVEERLRKAQARCQPNVDGRASQKRRRADVAAYSIRRESSSFEPVFQIGFERVLRRAQVLGPAVRCVIAAKESSTLVDIDLARGTEIRRIRNPVPLVDAWFEPHGRGIGVSRAVAAGRGRTRLWFLGTDGRVAAESVVGDAVSEIALGPDLWYVGCRDGCLYAFGFDGRLYWTWITPGSQDFEGAAYERPSPYRVSSRRSFAAVAWRDNIWAVSPRGQTLWHAAMPVRRDRVGTDNPDPGRARPASSLEDPWSSRRRATRRGGNRRTRNDRTCGSSHEAARSTRRTCLQSRS